MKLEDAWTISELDSRPVVLALAGPNGAGKTTFFEAHLKQSGLRFLNADFFAKEMQIDAYRAAEIMGALRRELIAQRESFIFETVFSDPVGDKLALLHDAAQRGYTVALCFIGISGPRKSEERVAMRVSQGGHNVAHEKLVARFPRTIANLRRAIREVPNVLIFDNDNLADAFRPVAVFRQGEPRHLEKPVPAWLKPALSRPVNPPPTPR